MFESMKTTMNTVKTTLLGLVVAASFAFAGCATHQHTSAACCAKAKCCASEKCCEGGAKCCATAASCCAKAESACCKKM